MTKVSYQKTVNVACLLALAGMMPDAAFGLLMALSHLMLDLSHYLFGITESALSYLVEYIFHTETRETQAIVFYLMAAIGLGVIYCLGRSIWRLFLALKEKLQSTYADYKNRLLCYWANSAANKFKLVAGLNVALTLAYLVGF